MAAEVASSLIFRIARGLAAVFSLIAAIVITLSQETAFVDSRHIVKIKAKDVSCFFGFMVAHIAVGVYGVLVAFIPKLSLLWRSVLASDLVVAMVMASFNAATMGIFYLEKKGNTHAFWDPICDIVQTYCLRLTVAVSFGYAALIIYILIVIYWICVTLNILLIEPPKKAAPPSAPPKP